MQLASGSDSGVRPRIAPRSTSAPSFHTTHTVIGSCPVVRKAPARGHRVAAREVGLRLERERGLAVLEHHEVPRRAHPRGARDERLPAIAVAVHAAGLGDHALVVAPEHEEDHGGDGTRRTSRGLR